MQVGECVDHQLHVGERRARELIEFAGRVDLVEDEEPPVALLVTEREAAPWHDVVQIRGEVLVEAVLAAPDVEESTDAAAARIGRRDLRDQPDRLAVGELDPETGEVAEDADPVAERGLLEVGHGAVERRAQPGRIDLVQ